MALTKIPFTKVNTPWVQAQMKRQGISLATLAKVLGLNKSSAFYLIRGKRRLQLPEAAKIADLLGVEVEVVLDNFGNSLSTPVNASRAIKVEGWIDSDLVLRKEGLKGKGSVPNPFSEKDIKVSRVQSPELQFFDGSLIFYRLNKKSTGVDVESLNKPCLVQVEGEKELRFGVLTRGYQPGRYNLSTLSGKLTKEDVKIRVSHPVVWIKWG